MPFRFSKVLLLIDASFGFEMEIFEFLNVVQVHGFPKIMGVLTHLDMLKKNKSLQKVKKRLKQRFWTEVYQVSTLNYQMESLWEFYTSSSFFLIKHSVLLIFQIDSSFPYNYFQLEAKIIFLQNWKWNVFWYSRCIFLHCEA